MSDDTVEVRGRKPVDVTGTSVMGAEALSLGSRAVQGNSGAQRETSRGGADEAESLHIAPLSGFVSPPSNRRWGNRRLV